MDKLLPAAEQADRLSLQDPLKIDRILRSSMKALSSLILASLLCISLYSAGCETSHTESDKPGWFGGNTHKETTVTKNPITGDTSVSHSEQTTP